MSVNAHTKIFPCSCTDLAFQKLKKSKKIRIENHVKVGKLLFWCNLRSRNFHKPEKYVFIYLTGTIHHAIVNGYFLVLYYSIWNWYSTCREASWLICTSWNWKLQSKGEILIKGAGCFTWNFFLLLVFFTHFCYSKSVTWFFISRLLNMEDFWNVIVNVSINDYFCWIYLCILLKMRFL